MKKLLAILSVCAILTSCSSAGTKPDPTTIPDYTNSTAEELGIDPEVFNSDEPVYTDCYQSEKIDMPEDVRYTSSVQKFGDSIMIVTISYELDKVIFLKTDPTFSEYVPFEWEHIEEENDADYSVSSPLFNPDGSFNVIVEIQNHGGVKFPEEFDNDFDYGEYFMPENYTSERYFCTYDKDGNMLTKTKFEYPDYAYDDSGYVSIGGNFSDGDSILCTNYHNGIIRLNSSGEFIRIREDDEEECVFNPPTFLHDRDGKVLCLICSCEGDNYESAVYNVYEFDNNELSSEPVCTFNYTNYMNSSSAGCGKYRIFISMSDALYGLTDDGRLESVVNWFDSDIDSTNVYAISETEFVGIYDNKYLRLTPRDMREFANVTTLTIGIANNWQFNEYNDAIKSFNRSQSKYRLKPISLDSDVNSLNMMVLQGEAPDIMFGIENDIYLNYRKKGFFTNLYELIDTDDTLSRDSFLPNVISLLEAGDGGLYGVCDSFGVSTLFTKSSVWDKENWTFDEMINLYDNYDSFAHLYDFVTKSDMLNIMLHGISDIVDYENGTCNFDSPEFRQVLEFCNRHVYKETPPDKCEEAYAFSEYWSKKYSGLGDETYIFVSNTATEYNTVKTLYNCSDNELTFAGYPSDDGNGGLITPANMMCINSGCKDKQGAWEFIKYVIANTKGCPITKDGFEKFLDGQMSRKLSCSGTEIPPIDQSLRDRIGEYIKSCNKLGSTYNDYHGDTFDGDTTSIINEETDAYFLGEQSIDECIDHIQNRVSILVSERS